jgi:hypothetical protein
MHTERGALSCIEEKTAQVLAVEREVQAGELWEAR